GFFSTDITQIGKLAWAISDRDGLNTIRFDDAPGLQPDIGASEGVIGSTRHGNSLYVALDPGISTAVIALRPTRSPATAPAAEALRTASLKESRWQLSSLQREACGLSLQAEGFGAGEFTWEELPQVELT